ncbi:MAG TPA: FmdB family zinc ribbon protein [Propionibacteriaceae bacterium]|nr:FmdB family zinc ribbon protein [Propionibacteriaceae bacterium]
MPTYQYRCTECGEDLEAVQKFSDPALTTCPTCGGQLRKVFNAVGVVFKGSGFYRTDSRNGSKSGGDGDSSPDKPGPEKSGSPEKAETKSSDKEPAAAGSASSGSSSGKQPASSGASSTGSKSAES